jgi:hypothetical protein
LQNLNGKPLIERERKKPPRRNHLVEEAVMTGAQNPVLAVEANGEAIDSMEVERVDVALENVEKDGEGDLVVALTVIVVTDAETEPLHKRSQLNHQLQLNHQRQLQSRTHLQL